MPELTFDADGLPVWTNSTLMADRSGSDPDPLGEALAAVAAIGQPGGIPLPSPQPAFSPGAVPQGAPPTDDPGNALLNPSGGWDHPSPSAVDLPAVGSAHPGAQDLQPSGLPFAQAPVPAPTTGVPVPGGTAPAVPVQPAPAGKAGKGDALAQANAAVDAGQITAAEYAYQEQLARNEAARASADRRAAVVEQGAKDSAAADAQYQNARNLAQQQSEQETAQWMMQMEDLAKQEPNPKRWFANQSTFGKAMWLLSLAFGTKAAASAPGVQNVGLMMIQEELQRDMSEQRASLARQMEVMRTKGERIDKRTAQRLAVLKDDHSLRVGQLLALEKAALERANAPGSEEDKVAMASAHSWLAQQRLATAGSRATQAFQAKEAQLQRSHAAHQAELSRQQAERHFQLNRLDDITKEMLDRKMHYDLKAMEVDARANKAANAKMADTMSFDPAKSGISVVVKGKDGKPAIAPLRVSKDQHKEIRDISQPAQRATDQLLLIKKYIADGSFLERVAGADPELNMALTEGAYQTAKINDPRGIVTDADFANGMKSMLGFDLSTSMGRAAAEAKLKISGNDIQKAIDNKLAQIESRTNQEIGATVDADMIPEGGKLEWRAVDRHPAESQEETLAQAEARVAGAAKSDWLPSPYGPDPVNTIEDLEKAQEAAKAGATDALPKYQRTPGQRSHEKVVKEAVDKFNTDLAPGTIDRFATGYVKEVKGDKRAELEIEQAARKAKEAAIKAEEAVRTNIKVRTTYGDAPSRAEVVETLKQEGLGGMVEERAYVDEMMRAVEAAKPKFKK